MLDRALAVPQAIAFAKDILGRICRPLADEVGTGLAERHHVWRLRNLTAALHATQQRLAERVGGDRGQADPRVVLSVIEYASVVSAPELQEMWGGLLAASCSDQPDDENVVFVNLLAQMTSVQARILSYACEHSKLQIGGHGIGAEGMGNHNGGAYLWPRRPRLSIAPRHVARRRERQTRFVERLFGGDFHSFGSAADYRATSG